MLEQTNPLVLAFIGDAVHTLRVRANLANVDGKIADIHKQAIKKCCAAAQAKEFDELFASLNETERDIANRARNAKHHTVPKNCTLVDYQKATALEAVLGYRYLNKIPPFSKGVAQAEPVTGALGGTLCL